MPRRSLLMATALVVAIMVSMPLRGNADDASSGALAVDAGSDLVSEDSCAGVPRNTLLAACAPCTPGAACIVYDQDPHTPKLTGCDFDTGSTNAYCSNAGQTAKTCEFQCFAKLKEASVFEFAVPFKTTLPPSTPRKSAPPSLTVPTTEDVPYQSNTFVSAIGRLDVASTVTKLSIYGGRQEQATSGRVVEMSVDKEAFAAAPQLTSLALLNMNLDSELSRALASAPAGITSLNLRNTQLKTLPSGAFGKFEQLETLSLSTNMLTSANIELPKLYSLDLSENQLTSFTVTAPQLHSLDLSDNNLVAIPPSVFALTNLRTLNIGKNPIPGPLVLTLPQLFFLASLEKLTIEVRPGTPMTTSPPSTSTTTTGGDDNSTLSVAGVPVIVVPEESLNATVPLIDSDSSSSSSQSGSGSTGSGGGDALSPSVSNTTATVPSRNPTTSEIASSSKTGGDGSSTLLIVLIVVGAFVLVVASAFLLLWRKRRNAAKYNAALYFGEDSYTKMGSEANGSGSGASRSVYSGDLPSWADGELLSYRLRATDITDVRPIGTGSSAVVWLVSYRGGAHQLASKRLVEHGTLDASKLNKLVAEIKLAASLSHPSVVQFFGVAWTSETDLQALFEYMPNGDLRTFLAKTEPSPADWMPDKLRLALDVVEALVYTHSFDPPLVHRDLKSRNVLLNEDLKAKLSDFGCARFGSENDTMTTDGVGTGRWLAPEILSGSTSYDASSDMYSFGVLLTELDTHLVPYADSVGVPSGGGGVVSEATILQRVAQGDLQPSMSRSCPLVVRQIARACLSFHASHRPTAIQVAYSLRQALNPSST